SGPLQRGRPMDQSRSLITHFRVASIIIMRVFLWLHSRAGLRIAGQLRQLQAVNAVAAVRTRWETEKRAQASSRAFKMQSMPCRRRAEGFACCQGAILKTLSSAGRMAWLAKTWRFTGADGER